MGKKKSSTNMKKLPTAESSRSYLQQAASLSLREESSGKKQSNVNAKSMLKLDHIKDLAIWASGEASIPSLSAFFGRRLAATAEALGVPPEPALFSCQRCESILQPGYNCTIRIEKNKAKVCHRSKKPKLSTKNNVVYQCHFCSHQNLKRGTPKCYMQEILPKGKLLSKIDSANSSIQKSAKPEVIRGSNENTVDADVIALPEIASDDPLIAILSTPITKVGTTLLDTKKRNRSGSKKAVETGSNSNVTDAEKGTHALNKRKRKSWTSLKEIAEHNEHYSSRNFGNLTIPFFI